MAQLEALNREIVTEMTEPNTAVNERFKLDIQQYFDALSFPVICLLSAVDYSVKKVD